MLFKLIKLITPFKRYSYSKFIWIFSCHKVFQSKAIEELNSEIYLHLDVKYKWNSIPTMTAPLIKTKRCLFKTFFELNSLHVINQLNFQTLQTL